jgi:hypothetical protein
VVFAEFVNGENVRMIQRRQRFGFLFKPRCVAVLRGKHFGRNIPLQPLIPRPMVIRYSRGCWLELFTPWGTLVFGLFIE